MITFDTNRKNAITLHNDALQSIEEARLKNLNQDTEKARYYFEEAFRLEREAFLKGRKEGAKEGSIWPIFKSAIQLALSAQVPGEAIKFVKNVSKDATYSQKFQNSVKMFCDEMRLYEIYQKNGDYSDDSNNSGKLNIR